MNPSADLSCGEVSKTHPWIQQGRWHQCGPCRRSWWTSACRSSLPRPQSGRTWGGSSGRWWGAGTPSACGDRWKDEEPEEEKEAGVMVCKQEAFSWFLCVLHFMIISQVFPTNTINFVADSHVRFMHFYSKFMHSCFWPWLPSSLSFLLRHHSVWPQYCSSICTGAPVWAEGHQDTALFLCHYAKHTTGCSAEAGVPATVQHRRARGQVQHERLTEDSSAFKQLGNPFVVSAQ